MMRSLLASAMVVACAFCASATAQVVERHGGEARWEPLQASSPVAKLGGSADAVYSNLQTYRNQSFPPAGATQQVLNTITRMAADDLNLVGTPPYAINGFRFVVANLNAVDVSASPLVRFYLPDGPGGGPGTLIAAFTYNPIVFHAGVVGTIKTSTKFVLNSSSVWAGLVFDNNGGSTGATAAQLDNMALGIFSPPPLGTSADRYFVTTAAGSFASNNPAGTLTNFAGSPPADFGWEILAAQDVDLSITNSDGVATAFPGGTVVYTITAANAGPDTVFGARVVDTFPPGLTCTWTCAGSAGNTCAAAGNGDINDATVSLAVGGSVTYTATCAVASAATGTLVNTATIFAPGTAIESSIFNNTATDTDTIGAFADLAISKTDGITTATPGGSVTYTITASNAGPANASGATVSDTFPPTLACTWTCAGAGGGACTASGGGNINDAVSLPIGGSVTFTATCNISPAATGTLTNTATVTAPASIADPAPGNNAATDSDTLVVVPPATVPGAPAAVLALAGDAQAGVAFTAPASNGGAAITSYTATSSPGSFSASGAASPLVVSGLTNGTAYTFTVTATNSVGTGPASPPSNSVTPAAVPGPPTIGTATAAIAQASVTFTPPASTGGSPITSYTVTSSPGGISASGAGSPITVAGLTGGIAYTFTVTATNAIGTGLASAPSNSVTPPVLPGAPTAAVAIAGNTQATVSFTAPASNGGSPITSYTVTSAPGGLNANGAASPIIVSGLANGTAYTFTVRATNVVGVGPASLPSNSVIPAGVPGAPNMVAANARDGQATVVFTPPASNGGSPINFYTATCGTFSVTGPASPLIVNGLTNGTPYTCTVTATNAIGTGPASSPAGVTPSAVIRTYTASSATGSGTITAFFTGGGLTCSFTNSNFIPLTGDPASPPAGSMTAATFPHGLFDFTLGGCTPGATITMTIAYPAALPAGTQYWKYGPEPGTPTPHWYIMPATISGATVVFTITDGGRGDDDLAANGFIVDQGGPGIPPAGPTGPWQTPTLSQWATILLALMLLAFAAPSVRRRRS